MDHSNTRLASQLDRNPGSFPSLILVGSFSGGEVFWFCLGFSLVGLFGGEVVCFGGVGFFW